MPPPPLGHVLCLLAGSLAAPAFRHAAALGLRRLRRGARSKAPPTGEEDGLFDEERFEAWVSMRLGGPGRTTFWYSTGEVCAYPGGEPLALVEGFDALRCVRGRGGVVHQLSRKLFVVRDVSTGEVLRRWRGAPVRVIKYPYQQVSYSLTPDGRLFTEVTQGSGAGVTRMTGTSIAARRLSARGGFAFTCPVFLNLETEGGGAYRCYENYDFFTGGGGSARPHCSWVRYGATPPFSEQAVMHVVSWRLDSFAELPLRMREYALRHAPQWASPPRSLEEVASMQGFEGRRKGGPEEEES